MTRKISSLLVIALAAMAMSAAVSVAQASPATSAAQAGGTSAHTAQKSPKGQQRCYIGHTIRVIEARRRMNQIKSSIANAPKRIAKLKKAVNKRKKAFKETGTRSAARKLKKAKKALKQLKAAHKSNQAALPGAIERFQKANAQAVSKGCPNDDGTPKGRRG